MTSQSRPLKFRFWSGVKMFYDLENVMECLKQQMAFDAGARFPIPYDHVGEHGAAFMQFTGLLDKNGKEIYEGDIVRVLYTDWKSKDEDDPRTLDQYMKDIATTGYVAWDDYSTGWIIKVKSPMSMNDDGTVMSSIIHGPHGYREVIGNIYESPHLLKSE